MLFLYSNDLLKLHFYSAAFYYHNIIRAGPWHWTGSQVYNYYNYSIIGLKVPPPTYLPILLGLQNERRRKKKIPILRCTLCVIPIRSYIICILHRSDLFTAGRIFIRFTCRYYYCYIVRVLMGCGSVEICAWSRAGGLHSFRFPAYE